MGNVKNITKESEACQNTNIEIWREVEDNFYSPSIFTTKQSNIGINVGGNVVVLSVRDWHRLAAESYF